MKKAVTFAPGSSETDDVVRAWLRKLGINENDVSGYRITRRVGDMPTIELIMYFDDQPQQGEEGQ